MLMSVPCILYSLLSRPTNAPHTHKHTHTHTHTHTYIYIYKQYFIYRKYCYVFRYTTYHLQAALLFHFVKVIIIIINVKNSVKPID